MRVAVVIFLAIIASSALAAEPLPIWMTPAESLKAESYSPLVTLTPPPPGPVRAPADFDPADGVLLSWSWTFDDEVRDIVDAAQEHGYVWIGVESTTERTQVENNLTSNGVPLDSVEFLIYELNSVWIRDYGPWNIYLPDRQRAIVDPIYNRPRPLDDFFPEWLAGQWSENYYGPDLIHPGGNLFADGLDRMFCTDLVYAENPGKTAAEIDSVFHDFMGCTLVVLPRITGEYTGHVDMYAKLLAPDLVMVGEFPSGPNVAILDSVCSIFESMTSPYGTPYRVVRVPMPGGTSPCYSYTNSHFVNDLCMVPTYGFTADTTALRIYSENLPGYTVVGSDCSYIINSGGAIHCITMNAFARERVFIDHHVLQDTTDAPISYSLSCTVTPSYDDTIVYGDVTIAWRDSGNVIFTVDTLTESGGVFVGEIPARSAGTTVEYYLRAEDSGGTSMTHPYLAPDNLHRFHVSPSSGVADAGAALPSRLRLDPAYPNPFNPTTTLMYELPERRFVRVDVLDVLGRQVTVLEKGERVAGFHTVRFDASGLSSGTYFVRLRTEGESVVRKVTLLK